MPCAQGRVIVETARPAPPHFATCSGYRRPLLRRMSNEVSASADETAIPSSSGGITNHQRHEQQQRHSAGSSRGAVSKGTIAPQSPAMRPEDLGVTPWYLDDYSTTADTSPGPMGDRSSYPSYSHADRDSRPHLNGSTRNSSIESEFSKMAPPPVPRKAYMNLQDAMALLDETCPNVKPSPSLTPRTPRTPLTPFARNKRARSKSSDNSSNYSNDRLSDRSFETSKEKNKDKKRPFLRKIGISKTEDRPFFARLAPRIIGKPYLEKIGPSKAIERPFLDKIGSSKMLDKFTFDTPRNQRKNGVKAETRTNDAFKNNGIRHEIEHIATIKENVERLEVTIEETECKPLVIPQAATATHERRRSGKEFLLKMYSFETEDLESTVPTKDYRDPLRGSSLDNVLDSGPSSLPTENGDERPPRPESENQRQTGGAELLKCRVTTSEEIISSITCLDLVGEANSWSNSPRRAQRAKRESVIPVRRRILQDSREILPSDDSTPNSPTKRPISSVSPDREIVTRSSTLERGMFSPTKTRKSIIENMRMDNTRKSIKYNQFERRGISSDNLLAKDALSFVTATRTVSSDIGRTREISSQDSLATRRGVQEYTRETFKQIQDKFKLQEVHTETYAAFKRRTRAAQGITSRHEMLKLNLLPADISTPKATSKTEDVATAETNASKTTELKQNTSQESTVRSILKKQERIDYPNDHEADANASIRRPKRRIFHEPSQETMDLLTELRKVKSLLKTPSWEKIDLDFKPERMPKRILLTDKEFCLSVERENSVRRPSRIINSLETTEEGKVTSNKKEQGDKESRPNNEVKIDKKSTGPALFEKKCLSLDYADEETSQKLEIRAISLASTRNLPSETEENDDYPNLTLICDSKSYSSDVFNSPSEETNGKDEIGKPDRESPRKPSQNHCAEVDIAIPIDQKISNPKGDIQERTSDLYEIISPRSTPFRVKKRLGKISVEDSVKPENFTLGSKVDCRSVVQKRTKCLPL